MTNPGSPADTDGETAKCEHECSTPNISVCMARGFCLCAECGEPFRGFRNPASLPHPVPEEPIRVGPEPGCNWCGGFDGFHDDECNRPAPSSQTATAGIEEMAEAVHDAYLVTCARLGWPVKPSNAVPYAELSEDSKELDRASVRAVLAAASDPLVQTATAEQPIKCPCCGSTKVGPTAGNGCGDTHDCLVCYTHFTPASPVAAEGADSELREILDAFVPEPTARKAISDLFSQQQREIERERERIRELEGERDDALELGSELNQHACRLEIARDTNAQLFYESAAELALLKAEELTAEEEAVARIAATRFAQDIGRVGHGDPEMESALVSLRAKLSRRISSPVPPEKK